LCHVHTKYCAVHNIIMLCARVCCSKLYHNGPTTHQCINIAYTVRRALVRLGGGPRRKSEFPQRICNNRTIILLYTALDMYFSNFSFAHTHTHALVLTSGSRSARPRFHFRRDILIILLCSLQFWETSPSYYFCRSCCCCCFCLFVVVVPIRPDPIRRPSRVLSRHDRRVEQSKRFFRFRAWIKIVSQIHSVGIGILNSDLVI